ncbi:ABC Fe3+-hydroxamate/cobalamin transporter, ATPase subunit [Pandoraea thiooxydans]|uniref:ABC transporter ATP-binding protein n=1 Tax=Pandoraea thiooxydans TaxID=445709 RepID=A0A0G3EJP8_9BURK|nr:ABC transporter ATP-binding protein [Pandoraea thiooxydans]AKJ67160.1 ABC transporter ATP-binding protein [Pandoraea thiooxydans]APR94123.1 ABC Fe3+-hydroxamate/cobalamin transporter, ATPase subunit [Pandoraea thiooxydans]
MTAADAPLITLALCLRADERTLISDLNMTCGAGQIWCVAGPNGAGKTTLLHTLAGLRRRQAGETGEVSLAGRPLSRWRPEALARQRAFMPQQAHDAFGVTVLETVLAGRHPYLVQGRWGTWESAADVAHAQAALQALALLPLAGRDITTLSGGERQRVRLAALLAQQTPVMMLDEPVAHLDLHHQIECLQILARHVARTGGPVLFSCHDLNLGRRFATHALLLDGRGGWRAGPAREILSPAHCSEAFGYPLILLRDGPHEALIPAVGDEQASVRQDIRAQPGVEP